MTKRKKPKQLLDGYRFEGFTPRKVKGAFGDPKALIIALTRRSKKRSVARVGKRNRVGMIVSNVECATYRAVIGAYIWSWIYAAFTASGVTP
jgi:hypothetical protein